MSTGGQKGSGRSDRVEVSKHKLDPIIHQRESRERKDSGRQKDLTWDCPLCMENVTGKDVDFTPCECGYQLCRFCWHHIKTELNDRCPACRKSYSEQEKEGILDNAEIAHRRKSKMQYELQSTSSSQHPNLIFDLPVLPEYQHLADKRVIRRNLMYVIGIPYAQHQQSHTGCLSHDHEPIALEERLASKNCFGKYGKILKVVLNLKGRHGSVDSESSRFVRTISAFITFSTEDETTRAIKSVENSKFDGVTLRATYGTTKYCAFFLRGKKCPNQSQCLFLHSIEEPSGKEHANIYTMNQTNQSDTDVDAPRGSALHAGDKIKEIAMFLKSVLPNTSVHVGSEGDISMK